jgi:hypothetical protein
MSKLADQIREKNRLARMRLGQEAPDLIELPAHPEIRVAMVPLSERETQMGMIYGASLDVPDNSAGLQARNRAVSHSDLWNSLRDPSDLNAKVFDSVEDLIDELAPEEIDILLDNLATLMDYSSPHGDGLTDEVLDHLKKASETIEWSGLTGRRWAVVKLYLSVMSPELLQVSLYGLGSTESSTTRSENGESTSDASPS